MAERGPQKIGSVLTDLIKNLGLEKKLAEVDAVQSWNQVVGEKIAEVTQAIKISEGRLTVRVSDPVWRQQLVFLKREFIAAINARLGKAVVKDIFFA